MKRVSIFFSIVIIFATATSVSAATLPPLTHFAPGNTLQSADMQAIVQSISDLQSRPASGGSGGGVINDSVNITVSGDAKPANSALWLSGSLKGTGSAFNMPFANIMFADTATDITDGVGVTGLTVNHAVNQGAGTGNRIGILGILSHNTATPGSTADNQNWYTGIFAQALDNHADGGTASAPKGNFFGMGSITSLCPTCTYVSSLVGAEHDVIAPPGSSVREKIGLQIVQVNSDAVRGSAFDAAIAVVNDRLGYIAPFNTGAHPGWLYGIAFGKPGNDWPIAPEGTIIGATPTANQKTAAHGIDFSTVMFSADAFKSPGFVVSKTGAVTSNDAITSSGASAGLFFNDRTAAGTSAWYRQGGVTRLWDSVNGDVVAITNKGDVTVNRLCVKKSDGTAVCITGDQLAALLAK